MKVVNVGLIGERTLSAQFNIDNSTHSKFCFLSHSKISRFDFFHERHGHAWVVALGGGPLEFHAGHCPYRRRHVGQSPFRLVIPYDNLPSPALHEPVIRDGPPRMLARVRFHLVANQRGSIRRNTFQSMPGFIRPHGAIHERFDFDSGAFRPDMKPARPTFTANEPYGIVSVMRPFLNTLRMHPSTTPTNQHAATGSEL